MCPAVCPWPPRSRLGRRELAPARRGERLNPVGAALSGRGRGAPPPPFAARLPPAWPRLGRHKRGRAVVAVVVAVVVVGRWRPGRVEPPLTAGRASRLMAVGAAAVGSLPHRHAAAPRTAAPDATAPNSSAAHAQPQAPQ